MAVFNDDTTASRLRILSQSRLGLQEDRSSRQFAKPTKIDNTATLKVSPIGEMINGSIAGCAGKLLEFPFDTVKVRLQTQPVDLNGKGTHYAGPIDCLRKSLSHDGLRGLYRGLGAPLVGSMIENSALFVAYEHVQNLIRSMSNQTDRKSDLSLGQLCFAGYMSGALVSMILTPLELIKCQLQVQGLFSPKDSNHHKLPIDKSAVCPGPYQIFRNTIRQHGLFGLYRGHFATFLRESGGGAAWFGTYELIIHQIIRFKNDPKIQKKSDAQPLHLMTAGAVAGMAYNGAVFPADVVKSIQQTSSESPTFRQVAKRLYQKQGLRGFYQGCGMTLMRSAPTSAAIFSTYELLNRQLHWRF